MVYELILYRVFAEHGEYNDEETFYEGYDENEAYETYDLIDIHDIKNEHWQKFGCQLTIESFKDSYRLVYDLDDFESADDYPLEVYYDDETYYEKIDSEITHLNQRKLYPINEESDLLLNKVQEHFKRKYDARDGKYIEIDVEGSEGEFIGCIKLRLADHTWNVFNNDRFDKCNFYLSVVIANKNFSANRFGSQNQLEGNINEIELIFNTDTPKQKIIDSVNQEINEAIKRIKNAKKMIRYDDGGELDFSANKYLEKKYKHLQKRNSSFQDLPEIFIRIGLPKKVNGKYLPSRNHYVGGLEEGVSVFPARYSPNSGFVFVDLESERGWLRATYGSFQEAIKFGSKDKVFLLEGEPIVNSTGERIGGGDLEPLLDTKDLQVIGKLDPNKIVVNDKIEFYKGKKYLPDKETLGGIELKKYPKYFNGGKMKKIKRGGITYGRSHADGGIPVKNASTGQMLEVEGGEGIINKRSMASGKKVKLNGKEMSLCEAVSELNQMEGGVQFNCDDVEDRQFIQEMANGGELERGTRTEKEHIQVLKDLYEKRITPSQATKRIAKDHLKEDRHYYSKLAKMERKMAKGGKMLSKEQQREKVRKVMREFKEHKLHSGSKHGKIVTNPNQAIAIALSEAKSKKMENGGQAMDMAKYQEFFDKITRLNEDFRNKSAQYTQVVDEGIETKNNKKLDADERKTKIEALRKKALEKKDEMVSAREKLQGLSNMDSPFYAPKLAEGGQIPNVNYGQAGSFKVFAVKEDVSLYSLPKGGFDVQYEKEENGEYEFRVTIGKRSLPPIGILHPMFFNFYQNIVKYPQGDEPTMAVAKSYVTFNFPKTSTSLADFINMLRFANNQKAFLENYNPSTRSVYGGKSESSEDVEKLINIINDDIGTYLEDMGYTPSKESLQDLFKNDGYNRMIIFQELYLWLSQNPNPKDYHPTLLELLGKAFTLYKLKKADLIITNSNLGSKIKITSHNVSWDYAYKFDGIFHKPEQYASETATMFKIVPRLYQKGNTLKEFIGFLVLLVIAKRSQGF